MAKIYSWVESKAGEFIPEGAPVTIGEDGRAYRVETWKTVRVYARPETIDPKTALLEAQAGEDGVFRVKGEGIQEEEFERLRRAADKTFREGIEKMIRGVWEIPEEDGEPE